MKIKVLGDFIQIKVDKTKAGILGLESIKTADEYGEVIGIGPDVKLPLKVGDKIFYKSWATDIINNKGDVHIFVSERTGGICAIVK